MLKNIIIHGKVGAGKTTECKNSIKSILEDKDSCVAVYDRHNEYKEIDEKTYNGRLLKKQGEDGVDLLEFLKTYYYAASISNNKRFVLFIDGFPFHNIKLLDFIRQVKKLNSVNVEIQLVVQSMTDISYEEEADVYLPWLKEHFSEKHVK